MNREIGSINELALFAGAGGGILGSVLIGWRTVCAVEIDSYCREVLLQRQKDGLLPLFPIWDDVRTFDGGNWRGSVDVISAGFPCQPFSVAGKKLGDKDERNLWPDTIRIIREVGPRFCILENVPGLLAHGYVGRVFGDLAESGYDCRWDCIPASSIGANHQRDRLWIVAYTTERTDQQSIAQSGERKISASHERSNAEVAHTQIEPERRLPFRKSEKISLTRINGEDLAHTHGSGFGEQWWPKPIQKKQPPSQRIRWWETEPSVGRVANGVAHRVDQLRALGNGQVPGVVENAWGKLTENF